MSSSKRSSSAGDRGHQRRVVGARQVGAADRVLEEHVAGEQRSVDREGDVAGAVAGRGDDVDVEARELQALAAVERLLGLPRLDRPHAGREERVGSARIVSSARGQ